MKIERFRRQGFWLLGFFLVANIYLLPGNEHSPRALDLLAAILLLPFVAGVVGRGLRPSALAILVLLVIAPLGWAIIGGFEGLGETVRLSLRWLLIVPWGYALLKAADRREDHRALVWGLWWGLALNVGVLVLQYIGMTGLTTRLGLAATDSSFVSYDWVFIRNAGLHGHPNASGAVASLILPIGLSLYFRGRCRVWVPLLSCALLLIAGHITSSRAPLLVGVVSALAITAFSRRFWRAAVLGFVALLVIVPLMIRFGPPGGLVRWTDTAHMEANTTERLDTHLCALHICVDNPLGVGVEEAKRRLAECASITASHNAFLQVCMVFGVVPALLILVLLVRLAWLTTRGPDFHLAVEAVVALHVLGLFFFEEHLNNPTFIILTAWLVTAGATGVGALVRRPLPASITTSLLAIMAVGFLCSGCEEKPGVPDDYAGDCADTPEQRLVYLINRERAGAGVPSLEIEVRVAEAASIQVDRMARLGNLTPPSDELTTRLGMAGYTANQAAETIAGTYDRAETIVEYWLNDAVASTIMLSPDFIHVGVGYAENLASATGYYWLVNYAVSSGAASVPSDGCHP